ncbi:MAG: hypothetical protein ABIR67_15250 [Gaiellaceae bacterium]
MTDFIARMAARAVGEAPVAQPRLPALFEDPGSDSTSALAVAEDEVVAPAPRSAPGESGRPVRMPLFEPTATYGPVVDGSAVAANPVRLPPRRQARSVAQPAPEPRRAAKPQTPVLDASVDVGGEVGEQPQPTVANPVEGLIEVLDPPNPAVAAAAASPAPAAPAILTAAAIRSSRSAPAPDQPTVHIRIGRLEVRANLHDEAPARPQQREPAGEDALSLSDYLRGERGGP